MKKDGKRSENEIKKIQQQTSLVKKLREINQLGIKDCYDAVIDAQGNEELALNLLKRKSLAIANARANRSTPESIISAYTPTPRKGGPKSGALLKLGCETSFVAALPEFAAIAKQLTIQIDNFKVSYGYFEDIPQIEWNENLSLIFENIKNSKPKLSLKEVKKKAISSLYQNYACNVLMCQKFSLNENKTITVADYVYQQIGIFKENIKILSFARFEI